MRFTAFLDFDVDPKYGGISQVTLIIHAISHEAAFTAVMHTKDEMFAHLQMKNVNIYKTGY